jgi:putative hydrolase of the HAD superfamily
LFTEDEEYAQFIEFYRIIFAQLKIKVSEKKLGKLAWDIVYNDNRIKLYDDVIDGIKELKQKYKVIILSDAWPSLKRVLKNNGTLELIDGLIISCNYNETKESTKLFEIAIKEYNLIPGECVYIDDSIDNLKNSEKAGFKPILMDRRNEFENAEYPVIKGLNEIENVIEREESRG